MDFDCTPYLKDVARRERPRDLARERARELFSAVFEGRVSDLALGALMVALRLKGETAEELRGMLDALAPHVAAVRPPPPIAGAAGEGAPMTVVLPTYNGARKLPNLVPLLALLIAREGVPVLLHGTHHEERRVSSFEVLEALGHPPAASVAEAEERLAAHRLAALPLGVLSPPLARVLAVRRDVGLRNCGHTLAKVLLPGGMAPAQACRLVAITHPEFNTLMRELFSGTAANVLLMRGVEGEAVVRLHAPQPIEQIGLDAEVRTHELGEGEADLALPARDAAATAAWTVRVMKGQLAAPVAIARQAALIARIAAARSAQPSAYSARNFTSSAW